MSSNLLNSTSHDQQQPTASIFRSEPSDTTRGFLSSMASNSMSSASSHSGNESSRAAVVSTDTVHVRVGVGCFVRNADNENHILMGKRKGSHGAGKWALPG